MSRKLIGTNTIESLKSKSDNQVCKMHAVMLYWHQILDLQPFDNIPITVYNIHYTTLLENTGNYSTRANFKLNFPKMYIFGIKKSVFNTLYFIIILHYHTDKI